MKEIGTEDGDGQDEVHLRFHKQSEKLFMIMISITYNSLNRIRMYHSDEELKELISPTSKKQKSITELSSIVRLLFECPEDLGTKFAELSNNLSQYGDHNIELKIVKKFYNSINQLRLNSEVLAGLLKTFEHFEKQTVLKEFLKNRDRVRFFLIVMLWDNLFFEKENNLALMKFLNLVSSMGIYRPVLSQWCDDLAPDYLAKVIEHLHVSLENEFHKLQPNIIPEEMLPYVSLNIDNICMFLEMLNESNLRHPRIKAEKFNKPNMSDYFRPIDTFKLYLKKTKPLNFIRFPFILDLDYKYKLLQIQSIFEQKTNIHKNMQNQFENLITGMINLEPNLDNIIFLQFQINRHNILDDSLEKLGKTKHNLKSPLKIQFLGEEGSDQGGVKNQYFQLVTKQIFNPYLDMFLPKNNGRVYWFNGFSFQPPIRFEFVGMLFGLAIYNSVHLQVRFPRLLYKKILAKTQEEAQEIADIEDLRDIEPQIYRSLKHIQDSQESLNELELYFTIQLESFGEKVTEELVEDGFSIQLTQDNKNQYIMMYIQHLLNKHIEKQFLAFRRGFLKVVDTDLIKIFRPQELQTIICGNQVIDFQELQASTNYEGYTKDSPVIRNLWSVLKDLTLDEKKAFLVFCTGSDRVPLQGLKSLNFIIQKHANSDHLPTAHTCFNVLLLPEYQTKAKVKKNIDFILKNNQGFGLI